MNEPTYLSIYYFLFISIYYLFIYLLINLFIYLFIIYLFIINNNSDKFYVFPAAT